MNQRHNNQIERAITILDKSPVVAIFAHHKDLLFQFRKTERIVAALYIITSILSDREPIRYEIRSLGTELIREVLSFRILPRDEKKTREVATRIARLVSLLDLADISDLLPSTHFSSLKRELVLLLATIEKGESEEEPMSFRDVLYGSKEKQKEDVLDGGLAPVASKGRFSRSSAIQDGRKSRILALLQEKGSVVVKDISEVIRDCSTKSIQRLLSDLVRAEILKTEGEKRWTRYTLKGGQKV